jgi:hypothetical protein
MFFLACRPLGAVFKCEAPVPQRLAGGRANAAYEYTDRQKQKKKKKERKKKGKENRK